MLGDFVFQVKTFCLLARPRFNKKDYAVGISDAIRRNNCVNHRLFRGIQPSNIKAAAQCWSTYKHATTIKYLIGITPQGLVSFISKGYGGRASDKSVTETSGFLDNLLSGDVVMADRGFLIEEEIKNRSAELQIPALTKGKSQLHPLDIEATRKIANVRIHVERIIGQLRQKFTILHQYKFPISLVKKTSATSVSTIDRIVGVCCGISNLCAPIVCKEENNMQNK